jgi:hypothetical protein
MRNRPALGLLVGLAMTASSTAARALDLTAGSGVVEDCPTSGRSIRFDGAAVAYAEPMPILALSNYGAGNYDPGPANNIGVGIGYSDVSAALHGLCIALLYRADYYAQASRDMLDILVGNHYGHTFDSGRTYRAVMSEQTFRAEGLRLEKTIGFRLARQWSARLGLAASYLYGTEGNEQSLQGQVTATSPDYAAGAATWVRTQTDIDYATFNPFVAPGTPRGDGFSTDAELVVSGPRGIAVTAQAMDALGRIYWQQVPHSVWTLMNTAIAYNANFDREALINGTESRLSSVEDIPTKLRFAANVPVADGWRADLEDDEVNGYHFPSFGPGFGNQRVNAWLHYDVRTEAVELGAQLSWVAVSLATNRLDLGRATALGASLHLARAW